MVDHGVYHTASRDSALLPLTWIWGEVSMLATVFSSEFISRRRRELDALQKWLCAWNAEQFASRHQGDSQLRSSAMGARHTRSTELLLETG